jgi:hypothetical protein
MIGEAIGDISGQRPPQKVYYRLPIQGISIGKFRQNRKRSMETADRPQRSQQG